MVKPCFRFLSNDDVLAELYSRASSDEKHRVIGFIHNIGELRVATEKAWYSIYVQANKLSRRVGFNLRTIAPMKACVSRRIRVTEPSLKGFSNRLAKLLINVFPFGGVSVRLSVSLDQTVQIGDIIHFLKSREIAVAYRGRKFERFWDFVLFLKMSILRSIFKDEMLDKIRVDFGQQRFILFARSAGNGIMLKPEELAGLLLLDPDPRSLQEAIVEDMERRRTGMRKGDRIVISRRGLHVETPTLDEPRRVGSRNLFRSILSACSAIAQAQEETLNAFSTAIGGLVSSPNKNLDSILVSLATSLNPAFVGNRVPSQTLLPLATWRKFYNMNTEKLNLMRLHEIVTKHAEALTAVVPPVFLSKILTWLRLIPTEHFDTYLESIRSKTRLTPIGIDRLNLPENAKTALLELVEYYRSSFFADGSRGRIPSSGYARISDIAKKSGLPLNEFYGQSGIVARLKGLNLIQVGEERSSGRTGKAIVLRINPENQMIREYLRLLGAGPDKTRLSSRPS